MSNLKKDDLNKEVMIDFLQLNLDNKMRIWHARWIIYSRL